MKIVIVGAGAIGSLLAALLSKSGQEIWLLDKDKARAERISLQGITVEGLSGNWNMPVKATAEAKDIGAADLLIISVKSYNTKEAAEKAKPVVGECTAILTLQNGIGNIEILSEIFGPERVLGGVTNMGATFLETGKVRHAGKGQTLIGRIDGRITVGMRAVREAFNKARIETRISRDIRGVLWSKLVINAGINALSAVVRLPNGRLLEFEGARRIMRQAVTEALRLAKKRRIRLLYEDPLAKVEAVCEATSGNISSMLQDVLRKKQTEIDFINGVIVRQGQELGIPVPVNALLVDLVKIIEVSYALEAGR